MKERNFILTSTKFRGSVLYKYGLNGFLTELKVQAEFTKEQHEWTVKTIPYHISLIDKLKKMSETIKIDEVPVDLSFDHFWKTYGNYSGKKKICRGLWEALNEAERSKCLNYIPIYKSAKARDGTNLAYPETYINNRVWE